MQKNNFASISNQFQIDRTNILGSGSTGQVYFGRQIETQSPVAIKLIKLNTINNEVTKYLFKMEKLALTILNHQNVLKGIQIIQNSSKCYMVTEYCNGGTLKQHIQTCGKIPEQKALNIIKGVLRGYNSLVRRKIVHRDLKPANIMLHNDCPKIIDFGYCEVQGHEKPTLQYNVGSPSYMAPQSFHQNIYNQKSQIWSIGVILYECLMGKTFDEGKHMSVVFKQIKKSGLPFLTLISEKCRKIIRRCLQMNPNKRPTALELLDQLIQNKEKQSGFVILQKKKSMSLFMSPQSGLTSKKSVSKNKIIKHPKITPLRHQRSGSGYSCIDNQPQITRTTSSKYQTAGKTDRVILRQQCNKVSYSTKNLQQYVRNEYGLTSRDSCNDQYKKKASEYIFSPKTGFTYVSTTPNKTELQVKQQQPTKKPLFKKIITVQKNPQSLGSTQENSSKKQVPFEQYFTEANQTSSNNNKLPNKKTQKQSYVPFDYRKVYTQKAKFKMILKKQNVNHDLGQYIFTSYANPLNHNINEIQNVKQNLHYTIQKNDYQKNIKQNTHSVYQSSHNAPTAFKSHNEYNSSKPKPASFFSKIFSPFSQKTYR